ncbi:MAG: hypothetical protein IJ326_02800 [Lachnospiraceae bacterium]|nr:hypothetical protein [Lachnospiraceae bacterium]
MYKKIIGIVLIMCIMGNASVVNAAEYTLTEKEEIYKEYQNDEQFCMMLQEYGEEYAEEFIEDVLNSRYRKMMRGGGGNECYQYVTNIKQTKTYNCGTTTALQTLYGLGSAGNVPGEDNSAKISTLDAKYNVDGQGHLIVYQLRNALNEYNKGSQRYIYEVGKNMTINTFEDNIARSLTNCKPVVLHAKTKYLTYYGGKDLNHYLSVDYINRTTDKVRIVDCNYNPEYYGVHIVTLEEAYNTINAETNRYMIY